MQPTMQLAAPTPVKKATNLSLSAATLDRARELGLNLSQTVDRLLAKEVRRLEAEAWLEHNRAVIDAYNARIEREGTFAEQVQRWLRDNPDA
ncbi:MAG: type II toxin-antitoxin system CcdA family antitoxin [Betaproteobacteria bacterium]|jgi:antitoxin CcdA